MPLRKAKELEAVQMPKEPSKYELREIAAERNLGEKKKKEKNRKKNKPPMILNPNTRKQLEAIEDL